MLLWVNIGLLAWYVQCLRKLLFVVVFKSLHHPSFHFSFHFLFHLILHCREIIWLNLSSLTGIKQLHASTWSRLTNTFFVKQKYGPHLRKIPAYTICGQLDCLASFSGWGGIEHHSLQIPTISTFSRTGAHFCAKRPLQPVTSSRVAIRTHTTYTT